MTTYNHQHHHHHSHLYKKVAVVVVITVVRVENVVVIGVLGGRDGFYCGGGGYGWEYVAMVL